MQERAMDRVDARFRHSKWSCWFSLGIENGDEHLQPRQLGPDFNYLHGVIPPTRGFHLGRRQHAKRQTGNGRVNPGLGAT